MAVQLRADKSNMLKVGSYKFHKEDVELIYNLHMTDQWTLWAIKETKFEDAKVKEIAVAVKHGQMDLEGKPSFQRSAHSYDPSSIVLRLE